MKIRLSEIARQEHYVWDDLLSLAKEKLAPEMITGVGLNTWIDEVGQEILLEAIDVPEAVPTHHHARVIKVAPNKKYVYAFIRDLNTKVAVLVPKKLSQRLVGKSILIESIEDTNGISYRYRRT